MVLEGILNIAKGGMNAQVRSFERAASAVANPSAYPQTDMSEALLDSQMSAQVYKANAIAFETGIDFWDMLLMIKRDDE